MNRIEAATFIISIVILLLAISKYPVSVYISSLNDTLSYRTVNGFGKERVRSLLLSDADVSYKYAVISGNMRGYRLRLSNGNNKITIEEGYRDTRFSKEQLDQMVTIINKYQAVSN